MMFDGWWKVYLESLVFKAGSQRARRTIPIAIEKRSLITFKTFVVFFVVLCGLCGLSLNTKRQRFKGISISLVYDVS